MAGFWISTESLGRIPGAGDRTQLLIKIKYLLLRGANWSTCEVAAQYDSEQRDQGDGCHLDYGIEPGCDKPRRWRQPCCRENNKLNAAKCSSLGIPKKKRYRQGDPCEVVIHE